MRKYTPESLQGEVARIVENTVAFDFGPEQFTREIVASCLNLRSEEISETDWSDISEFAVNAGSDMLRAQLREVHPQPFTDESINELLDPTLQKIPGFNALHDLIHAAEAYRLREGESAVPLFLEIGTERSHLDISASLSELYAELFDSPSWLGIDVPFPVALLTPQLKERITGAYAHVRFPERRRSIIVEILQERCPATVEERRKWYERFVEQLILGTAENALGELSPEREDSFHRDFTVATEVPPDHYLRFANRVFNEDWRTDRRLFLNELLSCIRIKPTTAS